jgi:hypothetical protein
LVHWVVWVGWGHLCDEARSAVRATSVLVVVLLTEAARRSAIGADLSKGDGAYKARCPDQGKRGELQLSTFTP